MIKMNINNMPFTSGKWPLDPSLATIIFIHGAGNSKILWDAQVKGLFGDMNTIAVDLPGHGESNEEGMKSVDDYARCIEEFIAAVNPPSPVPCGLSMGGAITLSLLVNAGIKFKAGIIINSGARLKVMPAIFELIKNNYSGYIGSIPMMAASPSTDRSRIQEIVSDAGNCNPDVVYNDFTACNTFDITESLNKIEIPVLVMTAEEDKLTPQKQGKFLADNIAGSSHVNVLKAGHFSPAEQPEEVNEAILKFIKTIKF
jgi:pimeloyl-ACP methyl ester carboxylesterase